MTDAQIKYMAERFLTWKLPDNFNPDGGVSFTKVRNEGTAYAHKYEPVGTNLFDYTQATAMVRHMLDGLPGAPDLLRKTLETCRARIEAQTNVGIVSVDPDNEDPQHEFTELLPDIDDALRRAREGK